MKKMTLRFFSMLLVLSMVIGMVPMTVLAAPTEEEPVVETVVETVETEAVETESEDAASEEEIDFNFSMSEVAATLLSAEDVEIDEEDPSIIAVETELQEMTVLNAEGDPVPLTEEQKQQVLAMYQQYLDQWEANADVLGVQTPFFLQYNDKKDNLGVLGEMLVLSGASVDAVRGGYMTYDDLTGMIMNFYYGDQLGIKYYGSAVESARNEALQAVKDSGAQTEAQKLLVLNDWLAEVNTFDMPYIMNSDKEEGDEPMVAKNEQEHEHRDDVYNVIYGVYEQQIEDMFYNEIYAGVVANLRETFYKEAIKKMIADGYLEQVAQSEEITDIAKQLYYQDMYNKYLEEHPHEHSYTETVAKEATCTEDGQKTLTCECGDSKTEVITALGHTEVVDEAKAATCTETGLTEGKHCSACDTVLTAQEVVPVKAHDYGEDGTCSVCGAKENSDETPAECVHEWDDGVTTKEPTCTEAGEKTLTCTKCSVTKTEAIAASGHVDEGNDGYCDREGCNAAMGEPEVTVTVVEDTVNAEGDASDSTEEVNPDADAYAKEAVANATAEDLKPYVEMIVYADEDTTTDLEKDAAAYAEDFMNDPETEAAISKNGARAYLEAMLKDQIKDDATVAAYMAEIDGNCDTFIKDAETNGVEVQPGYKMTVEQMTQQQLASEDPMVDLDGDEKPDVSFKQAIQIYADQAATGLTDGILNYWEGTQFGALGEGASVCLGYSKAFTYLIQCMHPEIYGTSANADMSNAKNWKTRSQLYKENKDGTINIDSGYVVDMVRISFATDVTMYGETQENFNSDHFWNAVKVDDQWYYVDPCYTDVFVEVMNRDRAETDGNVNHLYFLFSHDSATSLYDGYYSDLKTLYDTAATDKSYEDSWTARIISDTTYNNSYAYYVYSSCDMISMMEEYNNMNSGESEDSEMDQSYEYKLVAHKLDGSDVGDGDTDYETLIEFNHMVDEETEETVSRVYNPSTGAMEEHEFLTAIYAKHVADTKAYPSLCITTAWYNGVLYFNLANYLLAYDENTGAVMVVKEYNSVSAKRDNTEAFGAVAFDVVSDASKADFTVENHPIAGIILKSDGKLYISHATNFSYISGKESSDSTHKTPSNADLRKNGKYGYEYEESNYNPDYSSFSQTNEDYDSSMMEQYGYKEEINDNDEFMWSANFVETQSMSSVAVSACSSHSYEEITVEATCEHNKYTMNRCSKCGAVEAGSYTETADTVLNHHYAYFAETYYTKDDNDKWNSGECYVCVDCDFAIEEPTEPSKNANWEESGSSYEEEYAKYEEELAIWNNAVETVGHTYKPTDAVLSEDHLTVSFSKVECNAACIDRAKTLDCLLKNDTITQTLRTKKEVETTVDSYRGDCTTGAYATYVASCEVDGGVVYYEEEVQLEPGEHAYTGAWTWTANDAGSYDATVSVECAICGDAHENVVAEVVEDTEASVAPTIEASGKKVFKATAVVKDAEDKTIGTLATTREDLLLAATELTTSNVASTGKIQLSWKAVDGATSYDIYCSKTKDGEFTYLNNIKSTKVKHSSVAAGEARYYYIVAIAEDAETGDVIAAAEASNISGRTCDLARPEVTASNVASTGKVKLTWKAIDGAVEYKVYRSTTGEDGTYKLMKTTEGTSYTNTNAVAGTKYYYKVRAIAENTNAHSAYAAKTRTCDLARPEVTATNVASSGKIKLTWEAVEGAVEYKVYRSTSGEDGTYKLMKTTEGTSYTNTNAAAGTKYYYKVRAIAENTDASSAYTAKTRTCDLGRPDVKISRNNKGKPALTWKAIDGAVEYKVYRATTKDGEYKLMKTTEGTSYTNTNAKAGTTYYYKVKAIHSNTDANSAYSAIDSIKAK